MPKTHSESHRSDRVGWLRAAVLGANDGTISVSSLMVGIVTSAAPPQVVLLTGIAGLVAGAMSMAAGEYVSVSSQSDTEAADIARERHELGSQPERELAELTGIYVTRGLERDLAHQVAVKLMAVDALAAHARDELGITDTLRARPLQAAIASAASFFVGGAVPVLCALLAPAAHLTVTLWVAALSTLAASGAIAATLGGAPTVRGAIRVAFWGALAMGLTAGIGSLFGRGAPPP